MIKTDPKKMDGPFIVAGVIVVCSIFWFYTSQNSWLKLVAALSVLFGLCDACIMHINSSMTLDLNPERIKITTKVFSHTFVWGNLAVEQTKREFEVLTVFKCKTFPFWHKIKLEDDQTSFVINALQLASNDKEWLTTYLEYYGPKQYT